MARPRKQVANPTVVAIEEQHTVVKATIVEVKLKDTKIKGKHIIYTPLGMVVFKDGKANVSVAMEQLLKKEGFI